jgi:hypothetical protein
LARIPVVGGEWDVSASGFLWTQLKVEIDRDPLIAPAIRVAVSMDWHRLWPAFAQFDERDVRTAVAALDRVRDPVLRRLAKAVLDWLASEPPPTRLEACIRDAVGDDDAPWLDGELLRIRTIDSKTADEVRAVMNDFELDTNRAAEVLRHVAYLEDEVKGKGGGDFTRTAADVMEQTRGGAFGRARLLARNAPRDVTRDDPKRAREIVAEIVALAREFPDRLTPEDLPALHYVLAVAAAAEDDAAQARHHLEEALDAAGPGSERVQWNVLEGLSIVAFHEGDEEAELRHLESARALAESRWTVGIVAAYLDLEVALRETGCEAEAEKLRARLLAKLPDMLLDERIRGLEQLARLENDAGRLEYALEFATLALQLRNTVDYAFMTTIHALACGEGHTAHRAWLAIHEFERSRYGRASFETLGALARFAAADDDARLALDYLAEAVETVPAKDRAYYRSRFEDIRRMVEHDELSPEEVAEDELWSMIADNTERKQALRAEDSR